MEAAADWLASLSLRQHVRSCLLLPPPPPPAGHGAAREAHVHGADGTRATGAAPVHRTRPRYRRSPPRAPSAVRASGRGRTDPQRTSGGKSRTGTNAAPHGLKNKLGVGNIPSNRGPRVGGAPGAGNGELPVAFEPRKLPALRNTA